MTRRFPIQDGPSIPWHLIAPYEAQALRNHDQTLERLAARGGLSCAEANWVIECRPWCDRTDLRSDIEHRATLARRVREDEVSGIRRWAATWKRSAKIWRVRFHALLETVRIDAETRDVMREMSQFHEQNAAEKFAENDRLQVQLDEAIKALQDVVREACTAWPVERMVERCESALRALGAEP